MLLAPTNARRVLGLLTGTPGVGGRRVTRPATPDAAEASSRVARSLLARAAAPFLVLLTVALTTVAALAPAGSGSLASPQSAAAAAGGAAAAPAAAPGHRASRAEALDAGRTTGAAIVGGVAATAPRTATGIAGLLLGVDGTLVKPLIPLTRTAPGIRPVVQRHRTVRGDSLWSIARSYGTDTMSLWWANIDRLRDGLNVGHVLVIPPGHGVLHAVAEGDTLSSIAALYRSKPETIVTANAIQGDVVVLGQLLLIPDGHGPTYPKGLLPGRPAAEPARPVLVDSAPVTTAGPGTVGGRDGFFVAPDRVRPSTLLAGGALHYGDLVQGALSGATSRPAGSGSGTSSGPTAPDDGGPGTGGSAGNGGAMGSGGSTGESGPAASGTTPGSPSTDDDGEGTTAGTAPDEPWYLTTSPEVLDSWGLSDHDPDHQLQIVLHNDDAGRASRQLQAAAAREEARRDGVAQPAEEPPPSEPDAPARGPREGDPGISDEDQRKIPPFDPKLARLAAEVLQSDMRRFPSSGNGTRPGQGDLPSSGETVYGMPSRSQLLPFPGTEAEREAGITWLSQPISSARITQLYTRDHHGLDLAARAGSLVKSMAAGRVVWSGWRTNGGGYQVWVRHGAGVYTAYYHMSQLLVRPGQWVPRGKAVGVIGSTGYSTGIHLHLEVWRNGVPGTSDRRVNPLRYAKP